MPDDDPLTPGEIRRSFARLESEDRAQAARTTNLAAEMVPAKLWEAEHRAMADRQDRHETASNANQVRIERDMDEADHRLETELDALRLSVERENKDLRKEIKSVRDERAKRAEITWQKVVGLVVALATVAGVIVAVLALAKGIK